MKKLFTMIAFCAATSVCYTASAGSAIHAEATLSSQKTNSQYMSLAGSILRAGSGCDTLLNTNGAGDNDTPAVYTWQSPATGFVTGSASLSNGSSSFPVGAQAESFTAPASGEYVIWTFVEFGYVTVKATDSNQHATAYVYNNAGTSIQGNANAPGAALDSAYVTLRDVANDVTNQSGTYFRFPHQPALPAAGFYIVVSLPTTTGDTLVILSNTSSVSPGGSWINITGGGWSSVDSITGGGIALDDYIFAGVCASASPCPTITVTASEVSHTNSATATAAGGAGTYTYEWSNGASGATATGLTNHDTYTVTATDMNGCVGTATVSISTGISEISAGVANFSVYPNPSTGMFTASVSLTSASDVTISVLDITGSKIYESTDNAVSDLTKRMDLSSAAPGIYIVNIRTNTGSVNQRLTISK